MSKIDETYGNIAHTGANVKERLTAALRDNFAIIVLILNITFRIALELFDANVENPFTVDFFIKLGTDIATTMFCYCCFISYGHKMEKTIMPGYKDNCQKWSVLSGKVRSNMSETFERFCVARADEERDERRRAIIVNHTMIPWSVFDEKWRGKSKREVGDAVEKGELSRSEAFYVNRANGVIRVKPINPILILCGVRISSLNDVGRDGISPSTVSIISRPVLMFILNAGVAMLHGAWRGISTGEEIYNMIFSVVMIIMASVMGCSAGVNSARKEHDRIKGRIFFIEKFLESPTAQRVDTAAKE